MAEKNNSKGGSKGGVVSKYMKYLEGLVFPATKQDIQDIAEDHDTPEEAMMFIRQLPDKEYKDMNEVKSEVEHIIKSDTDPSEMASKLGM